MNLADGVGFSASKRMSTAKALVHVGRKFLRLNIHQIIYNLGLDSRPYPIMSTSCPASSRNVGSGSLDEGCTFRFIPSL